MTKRANESTSTAGTRYRALSVPEEDPTAEKTRKRSKPSVRSLAQPGSSSGPVPLKLLEMPELPNRAGQLKIGHVELVSLSQGWAGPALHPYWGLPLALAGRIVQQAAMDLARHPEPRPLLRLLRDIGRLDKASFHLKLLVIPTLPKPLRLQLAALEGLALNEYELRKSTRPAIPAPQSHVDYLALTWSLDFIASERWAKAVHLIGSVVKDDWHKPMWALERWRLTSDSDWDGWSKLIELNPQGLQELNLDLDLVIDEARAVFLAGCGRLHTLRFRENASSPSAPDLAWLARLPQLRNLYLPASVALQWVPPVVFARLTIFGITNSKRALSMQALPKEMPLTTKLHLELGEQHTEQQQILKQLLALGKRITALSMDKMGANLALHLPASLKTLEVRLATDYLASALKKLPQLNSLTMHGQVKDIEYLRDFLIAPDCTLRVLSMFLLPSPDWQSKLLEALASNQSLVELSLEGKSSGINTMQNAVTLATIIGKHPRLRKLNLRLGPKLATVAAIEPVLQAMRGNQVLRWVTLHFIITSKVSKQEQSALRKQLEALMQKHHKLFRFDFSVGGVLTELGNWRY